MQNIIAVARYQQKTGMVHVTLFGKVVETKCFTMEVYAVFKKMLLALQKDSKAEVTLVEYQFNVA